MPDWTLLLSALSAFLAGSVFLLVARHQARRRVGPEFSRALELFVVWWVGLALASFSIAGGETASWLGFHDATLFLALRVAAACALAVALWGLMHYLSTMLVGRNGLLVPLAVFFALYYAVTAFALALHAPAGIQPRTWHTELVYTIPWDDTGLRVALLMLFPPLAAALVFLTLAGLPLGGGRRTRVLLAAVGILSWSAAGILMRLDEAGGWGGGLLVLMGVGGALLVHAAYAPGRFSRRLRA